MKLNGCCINPVNKAKNIAKGFTAVITGKRTASSQARLRICNKCQFNTAGICRKCLCVIELKTRVPEESCPDNPPKW